MTFIGNAVELIIQLPKLLLNSHVFCGRNLTVLTCTHLKAIELFLLSTAVLKYTLRRPLKFVPWFSPRGGGGGILDFW